MLTAWCSTFLSSNEAPSPMAQPSVLDRVEGSGRPRPGRYRDQLAASIRFQLPASLVDQPVVAAAEQDQVPEQSRPAVNPVPEMVGVGPLDRRVAAGEPAVA